MIVGVVKLGLSNIDSVLRAVEKCGHNALIVDVPESVADADAIICPGVGAFPEAMSRLSRSGLREALCTEVLQGGKPFLGICLGMQLLASKGLEGKETEGLGWIDGTVRRLEPGDKRDRIPHIGWNEVHHGGQPLFEGIPDRSDFYFVHSYYLDCDSAGDVLATTPYCGSRVSAVRRDNIAGVQFHPEKSQKWGMMLLSNFFDQNAQPC